MTDTATPAGSTLRDGSSLYYSLMFSDANARLRACKTLTLIKTISSTLSEVSEPQVAEKKIHWWHEELERLAKQTARHPACKEVQAFLHNAKPVNAMVSILSAAANERYSPLETEQNLHDMVIADYSARLSLVQFALASNTLEANAPINNQNSIALGLGLTHRLGTLAERLHHGHAVFSDEHYAQHSLTPERLLNEPTAHKTLLTTAITNAGNALQQALEKPEQNNERTSSTPLPVQILTKLRCSQVDLWQKTTPDLVREYTALTPLRKFFIAYKCKLLG